MIAIKANKLSKSFGDKIAVDRVDLNIKEGELFSLLGVNGAGKTTTIKMLSCLIKPTSGSAEVLSEDVVKKAVAVKQNINVSPQETAVAPNLSVRENLQFIAEIYIQDKRRAKAKTDEMISQFKMENIASDKAEILSGGWKRRLNIAMALISEPKVLFLDEPTLGLDVLARRELWQMIENLKGKITMILTTHYLEEVIALSDRAAIMVGGKIVAVGTTKELTQQAKAKNFEDAFIKLSLGEVVS